MQMKTFTVPHYKKGVFYFTMSSYCGNKNTYVGLIYNEGKYPEAYCRLTVNLAVPLPKDMAFIDVNNGDEKIIAFLEAQGFIENTHKSFRSGYVEYPLYRLNLNKIEEYSDIGHAEEIIQGRISI